MTYIHILNPLIFICLAMHFFLQIYADSKRAEAMSTHCFTPRAKPSAFYTVGVTAC